MKNRVLLFSFVMLVAAASLSCGGGSKKNPNGVGEPCVSGVDFDGDGYGDGCEAGPDCNDADIEVNVDCCYGGNVFTGCKCDPYTDEDEVSCFDGDAALAGVGACIEGTRSCDRETQEWTACMGAVAPKFELCDNGVDNDCDGTSDEGVLSACDNCMTGCEQNSTGDDEPFPTEDDDENVDQDGVGLNPDGDLVLDSGMVETYFMWIANDGEGTVSKIDTRTGKEVARYPSVVPQDDLRLIDGDCRGVACDKSKVKAWNAGASGGGEADNRPSRTAIDIRQDCWVANRAHQVSGDQPTVTKFLNDNLFDDEGVHIGDCKDFNGDGIIQTSRDLNDDGQISTDVSDGEFFPGTGGVPTDECIAATVMVGEPGANARALAIDAGGFDVDQGGPDPSNPGNVWVGMFAEMAFYRVSLNFNGLTPQATTARVPADNGEVLPGNQQPYGAAIDSKGVVWSVDRYNNPARLVGINSGSDDFGDPVKTYVEESPGDYLHNGPDGYNYGIVIDLEDNIWIGGYSSDKVNRYAQDTGTWTTFDVGYTTRGMALDLNGYIWAAISDGGRVARIPADAADSSSVLVYDIDAATNPTYSTTAPIGVGVDFDGQVWLINRTSSNAARLQIDTVNDLDNDGFVGDPVGVTQALPTSNLVVDVYDNGYDEPYTYSDFTGLSLRAVTRPSGSYSAVIQGCVGDGEANWSAVHYDATVPLNTMLEVYVQVGNDLATLEDQPFYGPWTAPPADLDAPPGPVPDGKYLRLTLILISEDRVTTPIVHSYEVEWVCPGEGVQ